MTDVIDAEYTPATLAVQHEPQAGIMPTVSPDEARAQMQAYQALCAAVLVDDDYQTFRETKRELVDGRWQTVTITKKFKKKSAVKKLQTYFGISVDVVDQAVHRDELGDGHFGFRVKAVARSYGGRSVAALAGCATTEERFELRQYDDESDARFAVRQKKALARAYHDVLSTAETRATNRAVMNLISPGEVTAEEISRPEISRPDNSSKKQDRPAVATQAEHDEIAALTKALGLQTRAWIAANVIPGFDARKRPLTVAEYTAVKVALVALSAKRQPPAQDWHPSIPQRGLLMSLFAGRGYATAEQRHAFAEQVLGQGKGSSKTWTREEFESVIRALEALPTLAEYAKEHLSRNE